MTNSMNDLILTIALAEAGHPRVLTEVMKRNTNRARIALRLRIEGALIAANENKGVIDDRPEVRAAHLLGMCPGPLLKDRIAQVVESVIPD